VADAVRAFTENRSEWMGPAAELWTALNDLVDEDIRHARAWPGAPNTLSGRLKRLAPALRDIGIEYGEGRTGSKGTRLNNTHQERARKRPSVPSEASAS
jgi:hypothetical protein